MYNVIVTQSCLYYGLLSNTAVIRGGGAGGGGGGGGGRAGMYMYSLRL